jgi:predicted kinase
VRRPRPSDAPVRAQTRALAERVDEVVAGLLLEVEAPRPPHGSPSVLVLMGFPGVGKSHCARLLASRLRAAHVASDHLRRQLFVAPSYGQDENAMLFRVVDGLIDRLLDAGHRVIVDATHLRHDTRRSVAALALRRDVPIAYALVTSSERDTLARLALRSRSRAQDDHSEADERVYGAMRARGFEEPDVPYHTLVNGPDIAAEIDRVSSALEDRWSAAM